MPWVAALTDPDSIRTYVTGVGLPAEPPPIAPLRPPPQLELDGGYCSLPATIRHPFRHRAGGDYARPGRNHAPGPAMPPSPTPLSSPQAAAEPR